MSLADAAFAMADEMKKGTAELAKARETVEKLTKTLEGILGSLEQKAYVAQTAPGAPTQHEQGRTAQPGLKTNTPASPTKPTGLTLKTCNRCSAPLRMKDGKIEWKKGPGVGVFIPMNPDGTEHHCQGGGKP